jgi:hypothetical protein
MAASRVLRRSFGDAGATPVDQLDQHQVQHGRFNHRCPGSAASQWVEIPQCGVGYVVMVRRMICFRDNTIVFNHGPRQGRRLMSDAKMMLDAVNGHLGELDTQH